MLIGAATVGGALRIPADLSELFDLRSAAFFPCLVGVLIMVISFFLGRRALRGDPASPDPVAAAAATIQTRVDSGESSSEMAADGSPAAATPLPEVETEPPRYGRMIAATLLTVVYTYAVFKVGYWLASSVAMLLMALLHTTAGLTRAKVAWLIIACVVTPGVIIEAFRVFLAVSMPGAGGGY